MAIGRNFQSWLSWLPWYRRQTRDADLARELRDHLDLETDEQTSAGMSPEQAAYAAHRALGNTLKIEEDVRRAWGIQWLETLVQDLHYGLRMLRKSPGFTAVAILTLALGIGANTAILLRALPYSQPAQLYAIHEYVPQLASYGPSLPVNGGNFLAWKKESHAFAAMTLIDSADGALLGMGRPHWLYGAAVTSDFFAILGVQPLMGHAFLPEDGAYGGKPEIILTHELWRNQFHSDPGILGKAVNLGGRALTIIGVLPANFFFPRMLA